MKECFCGCGRTVPRFPLGIRSVNKRGQLVSERLAWARDVLGEHVDAEWAQEGDSLVSLLQQASHRELDPGSLDESAVRHWQQWGVQMEAVIVANGGPPINRWLAAGRLAPRD